MFDGDQMTDASMCDDRGKSTTPMRNMPDIGVVNMMSRDEQLKVLADAQYEEKCPPEIIARKISKEQEQLHVERMDRDVMRRKVHSTELKTRIERFTYMMLIRFLLMRD